MGGEVKWVRPSSARRRFHAGLPHASASSLVDTPPGSNEVWHSSSSFGLTGSEAVASLVRPIPEEGAEQPSCISMEERPHDDDEPTDVKF